MNLEQLGNIIRERRNELLLSQENLSSKSDVAIKTIHSVELGKANPSIKTLEKVLLNLGLEMIVVNKKNQEIGVEAWVSESKSPQFIKYQNK